LHTEVQIVGEEKGIYGWVWKKCRHRPYHWL